MEEKRDILELFQNLDFDKEILCLALINNMGDGLIAVDLDGFIQLINPIGEILTGWSAADVIDKNIAEIYQVKDLDQGIMLKQIPILKVFEEKETFSVKNRFSLTRKDGTQIPISETASAIVDASGNLAGAILLFREISDDLEAESRVEHLATHDFLTGLPNRRLFIDRLETEISQSRRRLQKIGVIYIDLSDFKQINDTLGHDIGDKVLKKVAQILKKNTRESDTVARIGGDEFSILLSNMQDRKDLVSAVAKVIAAFEQPVQIGDRMMDIGISMGDALFPDDADDVENLLDHADTLMYEHKQKTKRRK